MYRRAQLSTLKGRKIIPTSEESEGTADHIPIGTTNLRCRMQDVKSFTDAGDFGSFGRYEEVPIAHMAPEMKEAYEYTMQLRGIVPGPHKIWLANAALSQTIVPIGAYFTKSNLLSLRPRSKSSQCSRMRDGTPHMAPTSTRRLRRSSDTFLRRQPSA